MRFGFFGMMAITQQTSCILGKHKVATLQQERNHSLLQDKDFTNEVMFSQGNLFSLRLAATVKIVTGNAVLVRNAQHEVLKNGAACRSSVGESLPML